MGKPIKITIEIEGSESFVLVGASAEAFIEMLSRAQEAPPQDLIITEHQDKLVNDIDRAIAGWRPTEQRKREIEHEPRPPGP